MIYLDEFKLVNDTEEYRMILGKMRIFNSLYPLQIFPEKQLENIKFDDITIFYGGNGSGKTTLLNIISNKIGADYKNINNLGPLFEQYIEGCKCHFKNNKYKICKLILSDDVFDEQLNLRATNSNVNRLKDELIEEYYYLKKDVFAQEIINTKNSRVIQDKLDADKKTVSRFVRERMKNENKIQRSNGQTALDYWQNEIDEQAIYLIDEPENSLSAENQLKLKEYIEQSARFYDCQFIISTHSPFFLALDKAKIYDLDSCPVQCKKWTELDNVKAYYQLFKDNNDQFF